MKGAKELLLGFSIMVVVMAFASVGFAQSQMTLTAAKDNTLYEDAQGSISNGAGSYLFSGRIRSGETRRGLLYFAVADSLPAGITVDSVKLSLYMSKTHASVGSMPISLHRVMADWGEGMSDAPTEEGQGTAAAAGDATWLYTFFSSSTWANAGGDFLSNGSASQIVADTSEYTWGSTAPMVADVQNWLDFPESNFGWLVKGDETQPWTAKRFDSRENPIRIRRPRLTVYYESNIQSDVLDAGLAAPVSHDLYQNYPNPFNPSTAIQFYLAHGDEVTITILDVLGREIREIASGYYGPGRRSVTWDGRDASGAPVANGIYVYTLQAGSFSQTRKMTVLK